MTKIVITYDRVEVDVDNPDTSYVASLARTLWEDTRPAPANVPVGFALAPDDSISETVMS